jgi:hypothetical protein
MAEWDGKESSCSCNCGFDIPKGGKLDDLTLTNPLGLASGGTGVKTLDELKALLGITEDDPGDTPDPTPTGITLNGLGLYWGRTAATSSLSSSNPVNMYPSFGVTFKSAPIVFATPQTSKESAGAHGIWVYIESITTSNCTIRLSTTVTSASALGSVYANWIAIGTV